MRKAAFVVDSFYRQNHIFDASDTFLNRDNLLAPIHELKKKFAEHGIDLSTHDINTPEDSEFILYNDSPKSLPDPSFSDRSYLIALENPTICRGNAHPTNSERYRKIFTWNDELVDHAQFIKINFSATIPGSIPRNLERKDRLALLISANKSLNHEKELYSKRIETIRWFEKHHPTDFDLYGFNWDKYCFSGDYQYLNRSILLRKLWPMEKYTSWRGAIDSKAETFKHYRFCICYENLRDMPGYITEKIFDALFAGCVPVYRGADNITEYIPSSCFIDERNFSSHEELYEYLTTMDDTRYNGYLDAIEQFLQSDAISQFSIPYFVDTITSEILGGDQRQRPSK
jgi:hypothetical protein